MDIMLEPRYEKVKNGVRQFINFQNTFVLGKENKFFGRRASPLGRIFLNSHNHILIIAYIYR